MNLTKNVRRLFFLVVYPILWYISLLLSTYALQIQLHMGELAIVFTLTFLLRTTMFNLFHLYDVSWRFASIGEAFDLSVALLISEIPVVLILYLMDIPLSFRFYFVEFVISLLLSTALLVSKRIFLTFKTESSNYEKRKAILVGDTFKVEKFLRSMLDFKSPFFIDGVIATDKSTKGDFIRGVRIVGELNDLMFFVKNRVYDFVYIIEDSVEHDKLKQIIRECEYANIRLRIVSVDITYKNSSIFTVREVDTDDLLFRSEAKISSDTIENFVNHKKVLITGAAGSIGKELSYQVARFTPLKLILLDIDETNIYLLYNRLKEQFPYLDIVYFVTDITNEEKIKRIFITETVDIVFHAAAYKHVPVMELFPDEAVRVNVTGTYITAYNAALSGVNNFILISTDKAVNPTSIMGASKRLAEKIIVSLSGKYPKTHFLAVRFGNVLGSRGSVVPILSEQIKKGGPVTITHPDMERYFMTTKEAVLLVLESGAIGHSGEIYVLDMGKPVKILELAKELIRLHGLEPDIDIKIHFVGTRPGEKLSEILHSNDEKLSKTNIDKLMCLKPNGTFVFDYDEFIARAQVLIKKGDRESLKRLIMKNI